MIGHPAFPYAYLITSGASTDETFADDLTRLSAQLKMAVELGVELVQIREKALSSLSLYKLVIKAVDIARSSNTRILVNDRADIAAAAAAHGVHLPSAAIPASVIRARFPDLALAVSTHTSREAVEAQGSGADLIVFGPVFDSPPKVGVGIEALAEVCSAVSLPVLALGGVTAANLGEMLAVGASGVAGIRCFAAADAARQTIAGLKQI